MNHYPKITHTFASFLTFSRLIFIEIKTIMSISKNDN